MLENCGDVVEKFEKAVRLLGESKNDPESEPYRSKYEAKKLFTELKSSVKKLQEKVETDDAKKEVVILCSVLDYYIGLISVETLELSTGEEHLNKCIENLNGMETDQKCVVTYLSAANHLGILWSERGECEKSKEYLENSENKYLKFVETNPSMTGLCDMNDLFLNNFEPKDMDANVKKLEGIHTHTLYYLAQVYSGLGNTEQATLYCHSTLKRQLESKEYDALDWALNAATLAQCFISKNQFTTARHHLACASYILDRYEGELSSVEGSEEEINGKWEALKRCKADVARSWAKYGLNLLNASRDALTKHNDDDDDGAKKVVKALTANMNASETELADSAACSASNKTEVSFLSLEVTPVEEQVTTEHVYVFQEARDVFLNAKKWLDQAKEYYTLDDNASTNIQIVQELSSLYKILIFFEPNTDRQCKMHKRRVDLLDGVLKELNPQYYLDICRQLQFELGEIHNEMRDLKMSRFTDGDTHDATSMPNLQKLNHLAKQSISYFQSFLDTFRNSDRKIPEKFPQEMERAALLSYFYIGRLYSKLVSNEPPTQLTYLKDSVDNFNSLVNYCKRHEDAAKLMKSELDVCAEMAQLLPMKMDKILAGEPT